MPPEIHEVATPSPRPGLGALIVYLRPAPRARLLRLLAELGIFVIEQQGAAGAVQTAYGTRTDFVIVVGEDEPEHRRVAKELLAALSSVLVVLLPAEACSRHFTAAGAAVCIHDDAKDDEFGRLIGPALRQARALRTMGELAAEFIIGRDIVLRLMPPELERRGHTVPLTQVETEVLVGLVHARGMPVPTAELARRVAVLSRRTRVTRGYVKTIVLRIRRKLALMGGDPSILRNVRSIGYMLAALPGS
jgi:DNA-binding response OmpR family regulator